MKKVLITLSCAIFLMSCKTSSNVTSATNTTKNNVSVSIDLVNVIDDKVKVTITNPTITTETTTLTFLKLFQEPILKTIMEDLLTMLKLLTKKEIL